MGKNKSTRKSPTPPRGWVERPTPDLEITPPSQWKKPRIEGEVVTLPSGNVVRCARPGLDAFMEMGMVPNTLIPSIDASLSQAITPEKAMQEIASDVNALQETARFMDDVTMHCVVEPEVLPVPEDDDAGQPGERETDVLYIDKIDIEDKTFIFQFAVGGTRSVERFRQLKITDMAALAVEPLFDKSAESADED